MPTVWLLTFWLFNVSLFLHSVGKCISHSIHCEKKSICRPMERLIAVEVIHALRAFLGPTWRSVSFHAVGDCMFHVSNFTHAKCARGAWLAPSRNARGEGSTRGKELQEGNAQEFLSSSHLSFVESQLPLLSRQLQRHMLQQPGQPDVSAVCGMCDPGLLRRVLKCFLLVLAVS